jgi:hypothetical protein
MDEGPTDIIETSRHEIAVWRHGAEQLPVLVIDNYLDDPEAVIDAAATGPAFAPDGPYYPGIRAPFPPALLPALLSPLSGVLGSVFGYPRGAALRECTFSLVTAKPADLRPIQRLPHFDSLEPRRVAALLFLGKGEGHGGTAFYRQRATGYESVNAQRYDRFAAALNEDVARFGLPPQTYVGDDNDMYECLALHEARFNRMLVYESATLHSGHIPHDFAFSPDPRIGRLTVNAFLGAEA